MKRFSLLVSLLLVILNFKVISAQTFQFTREKIQITIGNNYAAVTGIYYFRNNYDHEISRSLFYPFPVNEILIYPDTIQVFHLKNIPVPFKKSSNGIRFSVSSPPDSEISVNVKYSQRFLSNEMKYILKSTQTWKQPLLKAEYKIMLPLEFTLHEISLKPDKQESDSAYNTFFIYKENFMPGDDLIIKWAGRE